VRFVADLKSGAPEVSAPVYSHLVYDIVPGRTQVIRSPDLLILEGLNVLQGGGPPPHHEDEGRPYVSDYFDFSIYVDADEAHITTWFLERFRRLRETAFRDPKSYFSKYAHLSDAEASAFARRVWEEINGLNLRENILPTRERAHLILEKGPDHRVERVRLRRL
jgi:type I pantothenate kinase